MPSFLTALIVANTSSDINKFYAFDKPLANEESNIHLILILLSPLTDIFLSKYSNFFLINTELDIDTY